VVIKKFRKDPQFAAIGAILALAVATIAGAFIFQALGYAPCELCLKERLPYYAGIAVAALALVFVALGLRRSLPPAASNGGSGAVRRIAREPSARASR
jgi:disulfide bond formation protein DsbB